MTRAVAIVGSRSWPDLDRVRAVVDTLPEGTVVVSGGARGVDTAAWLAAQARGLRAVVHLADWKKHGNAAGVIRNTAIVESCDEVIAFWDGESRGTADTIRKARAAGKPVRVVRP
jgi:hypothetical protein